MPRLLRHLLLILLTLSLPVSGLASVIVPGACEMPKTPMPMDHDDACCPHQQRADGNQHVDPHDNSQTNHGKPTSPCQSGADCTGAGFWLSSSPAVSQVDLPPAPRLLSWARVQVATGTPAAVWRPPQH